MSAVRLNEVIDFAITEEVRAGKLYTDTVKRVRNSGLISLLQELANMEKGHEAKLQAFKKGTPKLVSTAVTGGEDLKLSNYLVNVSLTPESTVQEVLLFAMQAEKKANALYTRLAKLCVEPEAAQLFQKLAAEEKQHKIDLEKAYDENIYREN